MDTAIVLYARDLRVRDNPALAGACARAREVGPHGRRHAATRRGRVHVAGPATPFIHTPWKLPGAQRRQLRHPEPLIDVGS